MRRMGRFTGRFVQGSVLDSGGRTPMAMVSKDDEYHEQPVTVTLKMGQQEAEMTTQQWLEFVSDINKALDAEGLL